MGSILVGSVAEACNCTPLAMERWPWGSGLKNSLELFDTIWLQSSWTHNVVTGQDTSISEYSAPLHGAPAAQATSKHVYFHYRVVVLLADLCQPASQVLPGWQLPAELPEVGQKLAELRWQCLKSPFPKLAALFGSFRTSTLKQFCHGHYRVGMLGNGQNILKKRAEKLSEWKESKIYCLHTLLMVMWPRLPRVLPIDLSAQQGYKDHQILNKLVKFTFAQIKSNLQKLGIGDTRNEGQYKEWAVTSAAFDLFAAKMDDFWQKELALTRT
ncbi:hypothetical protein DFH07DRAFT_1010781 [Mycena maculata]|uniref:Uncharacterized protein n=1 Tax=Mycena maculata TaxID=230809 RepID=A0AAD7P0B2_9AGAR|nr:hypothetical protein DFH07DRAFT_1010781 [Mycena maculata]